MKKLILVLALAPLAVMAADVSGPKQEGASTVAKATFPALARSTGVVKGLQPAMGRVIIVHEAIPALKWPAMTMSFRISTELAKDLKNDQKVEFEFVPKDMDGTITKVKVLP